MKQTQIDDALCRRLIAAALEARKRSYAPYSHYHVGAALWTQSGKLYTGCNIENAAYPATNCAERTALFKAVSEGEREFEAIAIVGGKAQEPPREYCAPCGVCRQALAEFCGADFRIYLGAEGKPTSAYRLSELLPEAFTPQNLS